MKLAKLEAIRGFAALYVAAAHTFGESLAIFKFAQEAVLVFFILSGFVIEYTFERKPDVTFSRYFTKRFLRIYSILIPLFMLVSGMGHSDIHKPDFGIILGGNLLMLQDVYYIKPNVIVPTLFASALWSLHYEWWFYMLYYPIRRGLVDHQRGILVSVAGVLCAGLYCYSPQVLPRLLMYFTTWWIGVEMARSYHRRGFVAVRDLVWSVGAVGCIAAILGVISLVHIRSGVSWSFGHHPILEFRHFVAALATTGAGLLWQAAKWRGFSVAMIFAPIAPFSYSLYIAHQPLFSFAEYLNGVSSPFIRWPILGLVLLLFCYLTEVKFYPWLRRRLHRWC